MHSKEMRGVVGTNGCSSSDLHDHKDKINWMNAWMSEIILQSNLTHLWVSCPGEELELEMTVPTAVNFMIHLPRTSESFLAPRIRHLITVWRCRRELDSRSPDFLQLCFLLVFWKSDIRKGIRGSNRPYLGGRRRQKRDGFASGYLNPCDCPALSLCHIHGSVLKQASVLLGSSGAGC